MMSEQGRFKLNLVGNIGVIVAICAAIISTVQLFDRLGAKVDVIQHDQGLIQENVHVLVDEQKHFHSQWEGEVKDGNQRLLLDEQRIQRSEDRINELMHKLNLPDPPP